MLVLPDPPTVAVMTAQPVAGLVTAACGGAWTHTGDGGSMRTVTVSMQPVVTLRNCSGTSIGPGCVPGAPLPVVQATLGKVKPVSGTAILNTCVAVPLMIV